MQKAAKKREKQDTYEGLSAVELIRLLQEKDAQIEVKQKHLDDKDHIIVEQQKRIELIEEYLRLAKVQHYGPRSEKMPGQSDMFDEAELEVALSELEAKLPEDDKVVQKTRPKKKRDRSFSDKLPRVQIHLTLSDDEKAGAITTFYTKVKEELDIIPAQARVLEYWQEKAVFEKDSGAESIKVAERPAHPLGKCRASIALLAYILVSKYADALPLYRLESILKRYGGSITRSAMANWIIRLEEVFRPLINLMREHQLESDYLQADETRLQVLKETGKTATSDKWMWVIRGGPPDQPVVLFEYDPTRAGGVPARLLVGFKGVLQADAYSGYNQICRDEGIRRIGCFDHCRRKFVEASKAAAPTVKKNPDKVSKADAAIGMIRGLYRIEDKIQDLDFEQKKAIRQQLSVPLLGEFKEWLDENANRVPKDSLTWKAINYARNQWEHLTYYCEDGKLNISNALAENAIRPFAVGRRNWLFSDTSHGARASATCFSLVETAKANNLDPYHYLHHVLKNIAMADTVEKLETLLPWNVDLTDEETISLQDINRRI